VDVDLGSEFERWLFHPLTARLLLVLVGLIAILVAARLIRRTATRYVSDDSLHYRARKFVSFLGYMAAFLFVALVFSDYLGGLPSPSASPAPASPLPFRR
jgi:hypothetical protein